MFEPFITISFIFNGSILKELESVLAKMEEQTVKFEYVMSEKPKLDLIEGGKKECSLPNEKCNKPESK
ncbi:hypothetical protein [Phocaeicola coprocola]